MQRRFFSRRKEGDENQVNQQAAVRESASRLWSRVWGQGRQVNSRHIKHGLLPRVEMEVLNGSAPASDFYQGLQVLIDQHSFKTEGVPGRIAVTASELRRRFDSGSLDVEALHERIRFYEVLSERYPDKSADKASIQMLLDLLKPEYEARFAAEMSGSRQASYSRSNERK